MSKHEKASDVRLEITQPLSSFVVVSIVIKVAIISFIRFLFSSGLVTNFFFLKNRTA